MTAATAFAARERPILFSGEMIRAILAGRKTQTRRVVVDRKARELRACEVNGTPWVTAHATADDRGVTLASPYGYKGDRLWVRESFAGPDHIGDGDQGVVGFGIEYKADGAFRAHGDCGCDGPCNGVLISHPWKPSIHMSREFSRITLELTDVRVERLQDISEDDAKAEGMDPSPQRFGWDGWEYRTAFARLWEDLNGRRYAWGSNPFVWVLSFRRVA